MNDDNLPATKENRQERFIRNLFLCKSMYEAAIKAGYSESYSKGPLYLKVKSPRFQKKVRDYAIANDVLSLPKVAMIENKVLDHLMENPKEANKYKDILRQKKQVSGILQQDDAPKVPTISIKSIKELSINLQQKRMDELDNTKQIEGEVVDAEII